ncbi:MAG: DNA mismatch repair protein MutS [Candidatus Woesearchaeota archaeon]
MGIDSSNLTPAMKQFHEVKQKYPDGIVLFRMGDFYETFYDDAKTAAKELDITLTSRGKGEKKAPLAGIPYHALEPYLAKLVKKGYKVVIVEQVEDPKKAKGLVKRDVVRVVTPGTVIEQSILDEKSNNYIMAIAVKEDEYSISLCDVSTGEFLATNPKKIECLQNDITRFCPAECILPITLAVNTELIKSLKLGGIFLTKYEDRHFRYDTALKRLTQHFKVLNMEGYGISEELPVQASGALLCYLQETQLNALKHISRISLVHESSEMVLDSSTIRNLELVGNIRDGSRRGSLLSVLDRTVTSMGSRLLRRWIKEPLLDVDEIRKRLNAVEILKKNRILHEELSGLLKGITDIERLISRVNYGSANARDLNSLKSSLRHLPFITETLVPVVNKLLEENLPNLLRELYHFEDFAELVEKLDSAIRDDAPVSIREGGMIKPSYNEELKKLHEIKTNGRSYISKLEAKEKEKTGIKNLRIGFNRVFGYYLEVSKSNLKLVPESYIRKQTTVNSERFITEELKEQESLILGAEEKLQELEYNIFQEIIREASSYTEKVQDAAKKIARLDVMLSFATVASSNNYVKPIVNDSKKIMLMESRHPVVECIEKSFIANDIILQDYEVMIITGPNMAGKSTVLRQAALNVLMAQLGCFVAASEAEVGIVDRIFTRVGAYDDLTMGQSTFMVEMIEAANILNNATSRSLIILDEIGRGTSTFDGVALAWSITEYIYNKVKAKTMFATHYHVMNKLEKEFERVKNYNISVMDTNEDIIFLRKLIEGGTDKSYGVHVAKLAGLPKDVIDRAREIQKKLEEEDEMMRKLKAKKMVEQKTLLEM